MMTDDLVIYRGMNGVRYILVFFYKRAWRGWRGKMNADDKVRTDLAREGVEHWAAGLDADPLTNEIEAASKLD